MLPVSTTAKLFLASSAINLSISVSSEYTPTVIQTDKLIWVPSIVTKTFALPLARAVTSPVSDTVKIFSSLDS